MHVYDILKRPVVTEKSNAQADNLRQYTFEVDQRANKMQVKDAVETAFNVKVVGVRIISIPAKTRTVRPLDNCEEAGAEEGGCHAGAGWHDPVLRRRLTPAQHRAGAG